MEVDGQSSSSSDYPGEERDSQPSLEDGPPPLEGEEEGFHDFALDPILLSIPSPLRCITVADRWPAMPCFGSIFYISQRSTVNNFADHLRTRCPRLGFCFWTTQDRCDECGQPTCRMHGYPYSQPDRNVARRIDRSTSPHSFYDFVCVRCRRTRDPIVMGGTMAEVRGWTEEFRFIDPLSGNLALSNSGNFRGALGQESQQRRHRELDAVVMIDLTDEDGPEF